MSGVLPQLYNVMVDIPNNWQRISNRYEGRESIPLNPLLAKTVTFSSTQVKLITIPGYYCIKTTLLGGLEGGGSLVAYSEGLGTLLHHPP